MFEVGLSELLVVALVALVVIGPEKLPAVARLAGFWLGKSRRTVAAVKAEMQLELQGEELRQRFIADELQRTLADGEAAIIDINEAMEALAAPAARGDTGKPVA
ncbi:Sec-independent protein translocase protein TatB [Methylomicrobium lacus]|uniref:Sec-independent protein translocase protein TatB n=1 Tax=Methylomicrobium lacus TaxID=136992 RepID=UPI0035A83550